MKKVITFSCLLLGLTACSLDSLTQEAFIAGIQETSGGVGASSTNISMSQSSAHKMNIACLV